MIVVLYATDQFAKELLRDLKIINRPASNRPVNFCVVWLATQKFECLRAYRKNLTAVFMNRHDRWFVQNDAVRWRIDQRIDGAQVNRQVLAEETAKNIHGFLKPRLLGSMSGDGIKL